VARSGSNKFLFILFVKGGTLPVSGLTLEVMDEIFGKGRPHVASV